MPGIDGTWRIISGSQAGYRVKAMLFGQSTEAVGRTEDVTGQIAIDGTSLATGTRPELPRGVARAADVTFTASPVNTGGCENRTSGLVAQDHRFHR